MPRTLGLCGAAVVAPLIAVAAISTEPSVLVWVGVLAGVVAVTASMLRDGPGSEHEAGWRTRHRGLAVGVATWLAVTALVGLGTIVGEATGAVLGVLAVLVTAAVAGRRRRHRNRRDRTRLEPDLDGQPGTREPRTREPRTQEPRTQELCRQWRHSHTLLTRARDPESAGQVADVRRRCLDELEERDPDAFARWLAAGPHQHDPAQFIGTGRDGAGDRTDPAGR